MQVSYTTSASLLGEVGSGLIDGRCPSNASSWVSPSSFSVALIPHLRTFLASNPNHRPCLDSLRTRNVLLFPDLSPTGKVGKHLCL